MKKLSKILALFFTAAMLICAIPTNFAFAANDEPLSEISAAEQASANALACTISGEGKLIILAAVIGLLIAGALVAVVVYKKRKSCTEATEGK